MSLQWVRLDTAFPSNPKVLTLVEDKQFKAICAYIGGLAYSGSHGTDGYLPKSSLPFIHATKREADQLVAVNLWIPHGRAGWDINGWNEFQPSTEETQARKLRAKAAAEVRWANR